MTFNGGVNEYFFSWCWLWFVIFQNYRTDQPFETRAKRPKLRKFVNILYHNTYLIYFFYMGYLMKVWLLQLLIIILFNIDRRRQIIIMLHLWKIHSEMRFAQFICFGIYIIFLLLNHSICNLHHPICSKVEGIFMGISHLWRLSPIC